jgi:myosin-3
VFRHAVLTPVTKAKELYDCNCIAGFLESSANNSYLKVQGEKEFSVAHYAGRVSYNAQDMVGKNQDFLPPDIIDTMRLSSDTVVKNLFTNQFSRTGNLIMSADDCGIITNTKDRWGAPLIAGNTSKTRVKRLHSLHNSFIPVQLVT